MYNMHPFMVSKRTYNASILIIVLLSILIIGAVLYKLMRSAIDYDTNKLKAMTSAEYSKVVPTSEVVVRTKIVPVTVYECPEELIDKLPTHREKVLRAHDMFYVQ